LDVKCQIMHVWGSLLVRRLGVGGLVTGMLVAGLLVAD